MAEKPSSSIKVYTPFNRRHTDERALDIQETRYLYESVRARYLKSPYAKENALRDFILRIAELIDTPLLPDFCVAMDGIVEMEEAIFGFPEVDLEHLSLVERVDLNRYLRAKDHFLAHPEYFTLLGDALHEIFAPLAELLPKTETPSPFVIPLIYALADAKLIVENLFRKLWSEEYVKAALFVNLTRQMHLNICEVSGISDPEKPNKPFLLPSKNPAPLSEVNELYLRNTPFKRFFDLPVPLRLDHETRFSHMHVLSGTSGGKTQMLQSLLMHDLESEDRPSIAIVDSQGDLISKLLRLDLPGYKPILVSPKDTPALNIFDVKRLDTYDKFEREQVTAGVIQTFDYLFTQLFGLDLTGKQTVFFRYVSRLMITLPDAMGRNATVLDMLTLMDDESPYKDAIEKLPPLQRQFFERDFKSQTFKQTKEQIRYRLQAILENPTLARIFTSTETKLDLFRALNEGSVILVDTAKDFLKGASSHFGMLFISLVFQAILERAVIPEGKRKPTFLMVDEASQYFSGQLDEMLSEIRKYKCGLVLLHQYLDQCTPQLRASLMANTAIKMATNVSTADARTMSAEMRCQPEFILSQPRLHFACHIRNVTPQAVSIPVQAGKMERHPKISDEKFEMLIASNRDQVCSSCPPPEENISVEEPGDDPGNNAFRW